MHDSIFAFKAQATPKPKSGTGGRKRFGKQLANKLHKFGKKSKIARLNLLKTQSQDAMEVDNTSDFQIAGSKGKRHKGSSLKYLTSNRAKLAALRSDVKAPRLDSQGRKSNGTTKNGRPIWFYPPAGLTPVDKVPYIGVKQPTAFQRKALDTEWICHTCHSGRHHYERCPTKLNH